MCRISLLLSLICVGCPCLALAQDYGRLLSIEAHAESDQSTGQIQIRWPLRTDLLGYVVRRETEDAQLSNLTFPANSTGFTDFVGMGQRVRYSISGDSIDTANPKAQGYLELGFQLPAEDAARGILVLVEAELQPSIADSLEQWTRDARSDGWLVRMKSINRSLPSPSVKGLIQEASALAPLQAVLLVGPIAVPYSGATAPDGHTDHYGAWPSDSYYGDLDSVWKDQSVTAISGAERNSNQPGDGKFDTNIIPSPKTKVAIGRIDFSDLPAFAPATEADLTRDYFQRNHLFRVGSLPTRSEALVIDGFPGYREGLAAGIRRDASALFGSGQTRSGSWFRQDDSPNYLLGYASGAGTFQSMAGVGSTSDFAQHQVGAHFTLLFGSYFGDWDVQNNLLRASLAAGSLAASWSGRPHLSLAPLATGRTLGECLLEAQSSQRNVRPVSGLFFKGVHLALMGDPTLRAFPTAPPLNLMGQETPAGYALQWSAPAGETMGYHVYRAHGPNAPFVRLTAQPLGEPHYLHSDAPPAGCYLVRRLSLTRTASGSFENLSLGALLHKPSSSLDAWKSSCFGDQSTDSQVAGNTADPDQDQCDNLLEYAMGTDPTKPTDTGLSCDGEGDHAVVSVGIDPAAVDARVILEQSSDLRSWTGIPDEQVERINGASDPRVLLQYRCDMGDARCEFYRLRVERR